MNTYDLTSQMLKYMDREKIRSIGRRSTMWPSQARVVTPTGVLGKCLRESYWTKKGETPTNPVNAEVKLMGYMGVQIEDGLIDICRNLGLWRGNNIKWYNEEENVSGEIDVIIGVPKEDLIVQNFPQHLLDRFPDKTEVLFNIECKSCSGYHINKSVFGYYQGRGSHRTYVPGRPKNAHLLQSSLYADVTRDKCIGTIIIYFSRDEAKMCQFLITTDDERNIYIDGEKELSFNIENIYESYRALQNHLDTDTLPECDFKHTYTDDEVKDLYAQKKISKTAYENHINKKKLYQDKQCTYCAFRDKCMGIDFENDELPAAFAYGSL